METQRGMNGSVALRTSGANRTIAWGKAVFLAAGIVILSSPLGWADLPGLRAPLPTEPATWEQFYNRLPGSSTTGPTINDADIQELARGLKYDPGLMYKIFYQI